MTFFSLVAALVLEQWRPLRADPVAHQAFGRYARLLEDRFNGGEGRHGILAWLLAVLPVIAGAAVVSFLLARWSPLAAWAWNVAVLYCTMGFRRFSHAFAGIQQALRADDLAGARAHLERWRGGSAQALGAGDIARLAIEEGLLASHRHVFGTLFWFVALGAPGAAFYQAAALLAESWGARQDPEAVEFGRFAARAFEWIDWAPTRLTAASFAIVGDFEDAAYCWRTQAGAWRARPDGILLAAGGGALGVRLGGVLPGEERPVAGTGEEVDVDHLEYAVGLIWRVLVLWLFLVLLVSLAHALG